MLFLARNIVYVLRMPLLYYMRLYVLLLWDYIYIYIILYEIIYVFFLFFFCIIWDYIYCFWQENIVQVLLRTCYMRYYMRLNILYYIILYIYFFWHEDILQVLRRRWARPCRRRHRSRARATPHPSRWRPVGRQWGLANLYAGRGGGWPYIRVLG